MPVLRLTDSRLKWTLAPINARGVIMEFVVQLNSGGARLVGRVPHHLRYLELEARVVRRYLGHGSGANGDVR